MREFISNKAIATIQPSWNRSKVYAVNFNNYWHRDEIMIAANKLEVDWNKEPLEVTTLPENAKLFFHSTSKFPRHKLELTTYKRKIKESGCDYIVGNFAKPNTRTRTWNHAWETEDMIFVSYMDSISIDVLQQEFEYDLHHATHYTDYQIYHVNKEELFYIDLITGKHSKPVISDSNLNTMVDNKLDRLNMEEVETLIQLIKSRDKENINLGLKLFAQFNLSSDPTFAWLFLTLHVRYFSGISSVLYTNLKKRFDPAKSAWYWSILNKLENNPPKDDHEKELITYLLKGWIQLESLSMGTYMRFKEYGYDLNLEGK